MVEIQIFLEYFENFKLGNLIYFEIFKKFKYFEIFKKFKHFEIFENSKHFVIFKKIEILQLKIILPNLRRNPSSVKVGVEFTIGGFQRMLHLESPKRLEAPMIAYDFSHL